MPIYEFTCSGCGHEFEKLVLGGSSAVECPGCGTSEVERRLSIFGVGASVASSGLASESGPAMGGG